MLSRCLHQQRRPRKIISVKYRRAEILKSWKFRMKARQSPNETAKVRIARRKLPWVETAGRQQLVPLACCEKEGHGWVRHSSLSIIEPDRRRSSIHLPIQPRLQRRWWITVQPKRQKIKSEGSKASYSYPSGRIGLVSQWTYSKRTRNRAMREYIERF